MSMYANLSSWKYSLSMVTSLSFEDSMFSLYLLRAESASQVADAKKWMHRKLSRSDWQLWTSWQKHIPTSIISWPFDLRFALLWVWQWVNSFMSQCLDIWRWFSQRQCPTPGLYSWPEKSHVSVNDSEKYNEFLLIGFADDKTVAGMVIMSDDRNRIQNDYNKLEQRVNSFSRD